MVSTAHWNFWLELSKDIVSKQIKKVKKLRSLLDLELILVNIMDLCMRLSETQLIQSTSWLSVIGQQESGVKNSKSTQLCKLGIMVHTLHQDVGLPLDLVFSF